MHNNIDWQSEEWKKKGWDNMEGILNDEMPNEKRRRPFLWIWLGAAASVILVASIFWWISTENKPKINESITLKETHPPEHASNQSKGIEESEINFFNQQEPNTKNKESSIVNYDESQPISKSGEASLSPVSKDKSKLISGSNKLNPKRTSKNNSVQRESKSTNFNNAETKVEISHRPTLEELTEKTISKSDATAVSQISSTEPNQGEVGGINIITKNNSNVISFNTLLKKLPIKLIYPKTTEFELLPSYTYYDNLLDPLTKTILLPRLSGHLFAGLNGGFNSYSVGWNAGAGVNLKISDRWTILSSIGIGRHQFKNMQFYQSDDMLVTPVETTVGDPIDGTFQVDEFTYVASEVNKKALLFLDIPLQVNYYFSKKLYLFTGFQYGKLIKIIENLSELAADKSLNAGRSVDQIEEINSNSLLNKHNFSILGGAGIRMGKFNVQFGLDYGYSNLLNKQIFIDASIHKRSINLKTYYQF